MSGQEQGINKRSVGGYYEDFAAEKLQEKGFEILEKNYHFHRSGEIDLIARQGRYLVFVEVKYRKSMTWGDPTEAVTFKKRVSISRAALGYLAMNGHPMDTPVRFDVFAVYGDGSFKHFENAFEYTNPGH